MVMAYLPGQMDSGMKASGKKIKSMVGVYSLGQKDKDIKVNGKMTSEMVMENL